MQRRRFLTMFPLGVALVSWPGRLLAAFRSSPGLRFHVAGVKYQGIEAADFECGTPVELRRERFEGETCFSIHAGGRRLGFVPRRLVRRVEGREVRVAFLSNVRPHAVPWKQLEVSLELAERG